ncbi:MAG: type II toxin-antitoxin system PrlF family antitoxin [Jannaschia sp.]
MRESTVTQRGQTTLPAQVRAALGLKPGDRLRYLVLDDGEVRLLRTRPVSDLQGVLKRPNQASVTEAEMQRAIGQGASDEDPSET